MAEVLEAVAVGEGGFERRVAIKRILPDHATDPSFVRMFIDEARIASRLHHANVVGVLDFGIAEGIPFQILEFVDGVDAKTLAKQGHATGFPMPVEVALHVCTEIAYALHHAHEAKDENGRALGIVHRDVSPHNFLVSRDGDVKLADFGIAIARDRQEKTQTGHAKGKLSYMAPEQAMGGGMDARTDVFGLGCALHALLTDRSPLSDEDAMTRLLTGTALSLDRSIPEDVLAVIARAVSRSKGDRFESAASMADALGAARARRANRDGRSLLREWLAKVNVEAPKGKLDALFDVELVLAEQQPDGTRRFTLAPATAATRPTRRRARVAFGIAGGIVAAAALLLTGRTLLPSRTATPTPVVRLDTPTAAPTPASTATILAAIATSPPVRTPSPRPSATKNAIVAVASPAYLVVAGEAVARGEVYLDGKRLGWSHETLQATVGSHRVEVRAGGKRYSTTANLSETNTRLSPWKWMVSTKDEIR